MLIGLFLVVYVAVALVNTSIVQSFLASAVSTHFTREWGGMVHVGAVHVTPLGEVKLRDILLVSPTDDTIFCGKAIDCRFSGIPLRNRTLKLSRVRIADMYYHLGFTPDGINMKYIFNYFNDGEEDDNTPREGITIKVHRLILDNIHYRQDLKHQSEYYGRYSHGVNVSRMDLTHIEGNFKDVVINTKPYICIDCRLLHLEAADRSGFRLRNLSGDIEVSKRNIVVHGMDLETDHTHMRSDVELKYARFKSFGHFFDSVETHVVLHEGTHFGLQDAGYWAPSLWGIDDSLALTGAFHGTLGQMQVDSMCLSFGHCSRFVAKGSVAGLPQVAATVFDLDIAHSQVDMRDLASLHQPEISPLFSLPYVLAPIGVVDIQGTTRGSLRKGTVALEAHTEAGDMTVQAVSSYDQHPRDLQYSVEITSDNIQVSRFIDAQKVCRSDLSMSVHGQGVTPDEMEAELDMELKNTLIGKHQIAPLRLHASLARRDLVARMSIDDPIAGITVDGKARIEGSESHYKIHADMSHLQLSELMGGNDSTKSITIDTRADLQLHGIDINKMRGRIDLRDSRVTIGARSATIDTLSVVLDEKQHYKTLSLDCDLLRLDVNGYLDYICLPQLWYQFADRYLPIDNSVDYSFDDSTAITTAFDISLHWRDYRRQLSALWPGMMVAPGTYLHGSYNYSETFKLAALSDSVRIGSVLFDEIGFSGNPVGESYGATVSVSRLATGNSTIMKEVRFFGSTNPKMSRIRLGWDDEQTLYDQGNVTFIVHHDPDVHRLQLTDGTIYLHGQQWNLTCEEVVMGPHYLQLPQLQLSSGRSRLVANAYALPTGEASAEALFDHFSVDIFDSLFLSEKNVHLKGDVEGRIHSERTAFDETPIVTAALRVDSCSVNGQPLGLVEIYSGIDREKRQIDLSATSTLSTDSTMQRPFSASGFVTMEKEPQVNVDVHLDNFSLAMVTPLLSSFAKHVDGLLSCNIEVTGPLSKPRVEGTAYIHDGMLQVDYTDVTYYVDDSVSFAHHRIDVADFHIRDADGHLLVAHGGIDYSDPERMQIALSLKSDGIQMFNTSDHKKSLYGTLVASVDGMVTGSPDNLVINATAITRKGSTITIPVDYKLTSTEQEYIHFVAHHSLQAQSTAADQPMQTAANMPAINLRLTITPDLTLQVPMDYNQLTANIAASGEGNLQLHTGAGRSPSLVGNYEFSSGTLDLNILSILDKSFSIDQGSSILFPGDINNIRFDISAVYSLRANISSLTGVESDNAQRNINVDDIINLSGSLQEPVLTFDIRLPNVDATTSEEVFSYIDRTDQRAMLNQSMSLLLMGQFHSSANDNQVRSSSATSGYSVMARSVSAVVSQLVRVVDVEVGYTAATDLTTEQFDIDISKSWDRFYFETTLGYGGEARSLSNDADTRAASNLVGDVLVGYKFNPRWHFFVFNRSNTNDYTRMELPYKQGMGMKFTRDFNRWGDLFRRQKNTQQ